MVICPEGGRKVVVRFMDGAFYVWREEMDEWVRQVHSLTPENIRVLHDLMERPYEEEAP